MLPVNYWPNTNFFWPLDFWNDYPAASVVVTVAVSFYVPNPATTQYVPSPTATLESTA